MKLLISMSAASSSGSYVDCCSADYSLIDCSDGRVNYGGLGYECSTASEIESFVCLSCTVATNSAGETCSQCCTSNALCLSRGMSQYTSLLAITAAVTILMVCICCILLTAASEKLRRKEGITVAQAYSIPNGMPVLRATVTNIRHNAVDRARGLTGTFSSSSSFAEDLAKYPVAGYISEDECKPTTFGSPIDLGALGLMGSPVLYRPQYDHRYADDGREEEKVYSTLPGDENSPPNQSRVRASFARDNVPVVIVNVGSIGEPLVSPPSEGSSTSALL